MQDNISHKPRVYLWIVLGVVIVVTVIIISKPFGREQDQMRVLRTIGQDQQQTDRVAGDVRGYIMEEQKIKDVDRSLIEFQSATETQ